MSLIFADRVLETSTTTGTGTLTLAGAVAGYQAFSAVCAANDQVNYYVEAVDTNGISIGAWETGLGIYSSNTLARDTVRASSNAGALVNFAAGTKRVGLSSIANYHSRIAAASQAVSTAFV